jgi:hypothetical protein
MTPQEAIKIAREFSNSNKEVLPLTTEAIDTLISKLEKQPQYPSEEEIRDEAEKSDIFYDEVDKMNVCMPRLSEDESESFIQGALWMLNKWKESNNINK